MSPTPPSLLCATVVGSRVVGQTVPCLETTPSTMTSPSSPPSTSAPTNFGDTFSPTQAPTPDPNHQPDPDPDGNPDPLPSPAPSPAPAPTRVVVNTTLRTTGATKARRRRRGRGLHRHRHRELRPDLAGGLVPNAGARHQERADYQQRCAVDDERLVPEAGTGLRGIWTSSATTFWSRLARRSRSW